MNNDRFKFRTWHKKSDGTFEMIYDAQATYDNACNGQGSVSHCDFQEVLDDPDCIVEQCTGLKDKNGRLIYEGDLLGESKDDEEFIEICWCDTLASFMYDIFPETYGNLETCHADYLAKFEIIGNIHQVELKG